MKLLCSCLRVALLVAAFTCVSCRAERDYTKVKLPPTPVLSTRSSWGVVSSDVLRIRKEPNQTADILTHIRHGALVEILSKTAQKDTVEEKAAYWFQVNYEGLRGWLFGAYIEIFASRSKAAQFAGTLDNNGGR